MIPSHLSFDRLKRSVTVQRVLAAEGLTRSLKRRGSRLVGPCPLHGGDNPNAFVVRLDKSLWYCFTRCDAGGDVVELVRRLRHGDYRDAARYLASLAATHVEPECGSWGPGSAPSPSPSTGSFRPYTRRLHLDPSAAFLAAKGIHSATARSFAAGAYYGPGFCAGCVAVRLHDPDGHPLGYAARRLDAELAHRLGKWKLPPRLPKSSLLYGYHRSAEAFAERGGILVEGPWGVMRLAQLGLPAVALLGTHLSQQQRRLLTAAHRLLLMLDGDPAGRRATWRLREQLAAVTDVRHVNLPDAHDPDDLADDQLRACASPLFW